MIIKPKRGEVYLVDCGIVIGSEQGGVRPAVVLQNDIGNRHSPTTIVAVLTSARKKKPLPTHVWLHTSASKFTKPSCVLLEQIRTVSLNRLKQYICMLDYSDMKRVDEALKISLAME